MRDLLPRPMDERPQIATQAALMLLRDRQHRPGGNRRVDRTAAGPERLDPRLGGDLVDRGDDRLGREAGAVRGEHRRQYITRPPDTFMSSPVIDAAAGDARKTAQAATSCGGVSRARGARDTIRSRTSSGVIDRVSAWAAITRSIRGPATNPGEMRVTRGGEGAPTPHTRGGGGTPHSPPRPAG